MSMNNIIKKKFTSKLRNYEIICIKLNKYTFSVCARALLQVQHFYRRNILRVHVIQNKNV